MHMVLIMTPLNFLENFFLSDGTEPKLTRLLVHGRNRLKVNLKDLP